MAGMDGAVGPSRTEARWERYLRWLRVDGTGAVALLVVEFAVILAVWQIAVDSLGLVSPVFLPPPSDIVSAFGELVARGELIAHATASLIAWFTGYALALGAGISIGYAIGTSLPAHYLVSPILWSFYAVPWLAYQPLSQAWFGFGLPPVIFLVFIASLFPILFNTAAGVGTTDRSLLSAGKVYGASRLAAFRKIVLPASLPFVFAGMRQSVVMATTALLVAEMTGPSVGMGALIIFKTNRFATDEAFAGIVIAVAWTVAMSELVAWLGRRVAPWQTDARAT